MKRAFLPLLVLAASSFLHTQPVKERGIVREGLPAPPSSSEEELKAPHGYALVIGIATYPTLKDNNLEFSERDAESIYDVLISQEGGNLPPENVRKLVGSKATLANIRQSLEEWLPSVAKEGDNVVVYFAGHGYIENGRGYLLPYDVNAGRLEQTAYPMDRLGQVFSKDIKSTWKVLLTDACHSGVITPEVTEQVNQRLSSVDPQVFSFTASHKRESSYESAEIGGGHGVFTYFVVQGLQGQADTDHNGVVTADELVDYVRSQVTKYTSDRGRHQTPSENQDFDHRLVLAYNPKLAATQHATLSQRNLIIEVNQDGVEVLLDGKVMDVVNKGKPLVLPGILPGTHTVQGNKTGYAPDGPREIVVYPGRDTTVTIRIQFARAIKKTAKSEFDQGLKLYNKGSEQECRQAIGYFQRALNEDPSYSEAAMYLGRTYQILFDTEAALKYLKQAIAIDATYLDAHLSYGSALLDAGNTDEAVRQFRYVTNSDARNSLAWSHLAQAYRMAGAYDKSVEAGREALRVNPSNAQAYLWMGDSLRAQKDYPAAQKAYSEYLRLTDFEAKTFEKVGSFLTSKLLAYDFVGIRRATEKQIFYDLRNQGYFGLCDCEQKSHNLNQAAQYCKKALRYDPSDPYSYFLLGWINVDRYNTTSDRSALLAAKGYFQQTVTINPDLEESVTAKAYIQRIDKLLQ